MAVSDASMYIMNSQLKSGKARIGELTSLYLRSSKAFWQFDSHWKSAPFLKNIWSGPVILE